MAFAKLTDLEAEALGAAEGLQQSLERADLMIRLADLRLEFTAMAEEGLACDPWLADQVETVQAAHRMAIAAGRAEEEARRARALLWRDGLPGRIAATRARALPDGGA